jgi:PAS domain S-box-containing protein
MKNVRPVKVLLIEDDPDDAGLAQRMLKKVGPMPFELAVADRLAAARAYLAENAVDVILLDLSLPDSQGIRTLTETQAMAPGVAVVVLTGLDDYELGIEAVNAGAQDCLVKGRVDGDLLRRAIGYAIERRRATEQLRYQAAVLAQIQEAVITTDLNFVIKSWNKAAETIYGWRADEVIGRPITDVLQTGFHGQSRESVIQQLLTQDVWQEEVTQHRKDGSPVFVLASDSLIRDDAGNPVGICLVERDMTLHQQAENVLRESERKFRSVIEQSVDGITLVDETGVIIEWNQAQEQITGLARADVVGRPLWDVQYQLTPEQRKTPAHYQVLKQKLLSFLQTGQMPLLARQIQRPDGDLRTIQASIYPLQTQKGFMASSIVRDVTEQERARRALEEAYLFLQYTLDALSAHIAILDETGAIIAVNEAWRQFADTNGLSDPAYGLGTSYLAVCESATGPWSEGAPEVAAGIRQALAAGNGGFYLEYPCHSPDEQRWFAVRLHRFEIGGAGRVVAAHYDITERKLAEQALAAERNLLRTLIDHMPDRVYAKDREGRFLIKNMADVRQMGAATPGEVIGKTDFDFYPEELAARYRADDQMVIQFGQSLINREEPAVAADGSQRWILTTKVPLRDSSQKIIGLVGIGRDVTERKRTQEQVEKLDAEMNALYNISKQLGQSLDLDTTFSTLHDAIAVHMDCAGLYVSSYNPEDHLIRCMWAWGDGERLDTGKFPVIPLAEAGRGTQSHVIRTGEALYVPDYQARVESARCPTDAAVEEGPDYQARVESAQTLYVAQADAGLVDRDQAPEEEPLPRSALFVPLNLEGRVLGVIQVFSYQRNAYSEDDLRFLKALAPQAAAAVANALLYRQAQHEVAERERAEAALRELNEVLEQRITERTGELRESEARYRAIVEDQTELLCRFLPDTTVMFVNGAYSRFFDLPREDLIGHPFEHTIFEDDLARWKKEFAALSRDNPVVTIEHRMMAGDGRIRWVQWTNRLITNGDDQRVEIQGVGRDITRQKQAEDVLRQALTREMDVNEMRSRFISMASHDLRTPLAVIQMSSDLLSLYSARLTEERKQEAHREINQAIQQMVTLLDDILIIGRAESGKLEFQPEPLDLRMYIQNLLTELKTALGTDHHLDFIATGECKRGWIDPKLLHHIVVNLVSNAIKYSPSNQAVTIELKCAESQIVLSVEDQGMGIPVDDQKHLFETFFRASNVGRIPGSGLGLAIVRQSVELHGGSITFESRPGKGTTFFVVLPCISLGEESGENDLDL